MRILAFDTATSATAVALVDVQRRDESGGLAVEARDDPPAGARPNHARRLLSLIEHVLESDGTGWDGVDRIAVGIGPGTFTGLRIGIATAHALSLARQIELVGVSTLAALALSGRQAGGTVPVLAILDARRGEAFAAAWAAHATPGRDDPVVPPAVLAPDELERVAMELGSGGLAIGDGALKFAASLQGSGLEVPGEDSDLHRVSARAHCQLAAGSTPGAPEAVSPLYLRLPDAEIARRA